MDNKWEVSDSLLCTLIFVLGFFQEYTAVSIAAVVIFLVHKEGTVRRMAGYALVIVLLIWTICFPVGFLYRFFSAVNYIIGVNAGFLSGLSSLSQWISRIAGLAGRIIFALLAYKAWCGGSINIDFINRILDGRAFSSVKTSAGSSERYCPHCGMSVLQGDRFCQKCGNPLK